jgi:hypothetical protein
MTKSVLRSIGFLFLALATSASVCRADDPWEPYRFLMGEWTTVGDQAMRSGGFTLATDLQGKVLVRKSRAEIPSAAGRPAVTHDDLMVIYQGEASKPAKAVYFDSEGHVIHYTASFSKDEKTLTFLSEPTSSAPGYRLTYEKGENDTVGIRFEIAPPGKPEEFKVYLTGKVRRVKKPN